MALIPKKKDDSAEPKPPKVKKELTEEQVKMRNMLIVMGVLALITAGIYVPPMFTSKPAPPVAVVPPTDETTPGGPKTPEPGATPVLGLPDQTPKPEVATAPTPEPAKGGATKAGKAPVAGAKPSLKVYGKPVADFRRDPFEPFFSGVVLPDPTPTPIPSVPIPIPRPAVQIPRPGGRFFANKTPLNQSEDMVALPPVHISRISEITTIPAVQSAFKKITGKGAASNVGEVGPAYNRRLSGVIIGDGVRALLEINKGDTIVTRVVQPGDEVDGILVLSIQRVTVGNQTITRMLVRENGEEKYVDLKPSDVKTTQPNGGAPGG